MLTLRIRSTSGQLFTMQVQSVELQQECPYDGGDFYVKPKVKRQYCCDSHRVMYYNKVTATAEITASR